MPPQVQSHAPARLKPKVTAAVPEVAMIMAAGFGKRMRPLTDKMPKPMVEVRGKPMINRILDKLAAAGVKKVVINLHYKGDMLKKHVEKTAPEGLDIAFSEEAEILETGGGVTKALPLLGDAPFFVVNGDIFWRDGTISTFADLAMRWNGDAMDALLLMVPTVDAVGYPGLGDFDMEPDGQLVRRPEQHVSPFLYGGIQLVHPRLFKDAPKGAFSTNILWDRAIEAGRLYGCRHQGEWMHVDTPETLATVNDLLDE